MNLRKKQESQEKKSVKFDLSKNKIYTTYSYIEYNRCPIDSFIYRLSYNKLTIMDVIKMQAELNEFKKSMTVHENSKNNTKFY